MIQGARRVGLLQSQVESNTRIKVTKHLIHNVLYSVNFKALNILVPVDRILRNSPKNSLLFAFFTLKNIFRAPRETPVADTFF